MVCSFKAKKKYESGCAVAYLTQKQALRKLQISLTNFRRLCILKGIYPVEPKHRNRANKGNTQPRVFYFAKDVAFLAREPLLETFRKMRVFQRKLRQAKEKGDAEAVFRIRMNKPRYTLHEIVRERYPSRDDAIRDINDSLNLIFLFSRLPKLAQFNAALIQLSRRIAVEFLNYVVATRAVRKAFISIKGFYIEAEISGISVVWIIPHCSATHCPSEVDYRTLATCLEFDITLLGSLLCNLYKNENLVYPPKLTMNVDSQAKYCTAREADLEYLACLSYPIMKSVADEQIEEIMGDDMAELKQMDDQVTQAISKQAELFKVKRLFEGKRFFLNREVPREVITMIVRSCGGFCSWDPISGPGATFKESDQQVDYQVVDRPMTDMKVGRYYVQPQWIFDSLNACRLMPVQDYMPGCELPAHLSPFALAVSETADPNVGVKQRETALSGAAPGFGAGAALYRPPEADYLAGLVTLAEIRGGPVAAQKEASRDNYDELVEPEDEDEEEDESEEEEEDESGEDEEVQQSSSSKKRAKVFDSSSVAKKTKKGEKEEEKKPVVKMVPGKVQTADEKSFKEQAQLNAQKKLQEMGIHKRHKRVYDAMKKSIKKQNKEVKTLQERRNNLDAQKKGKVAAGKAAKRR